MTEGIYGLGFKFLDYLDKAIEKGREKQVIAQIKRENPELYKGAMDYMKNKEKLAKDIEKTFPDADFAASAKRMDAFFLGDDDDK